MTREPLKFLAAEKFMWLFNIDFYKIYKFTDVLKRGVKLHNLHVNWTQKQENEITVR